MHAEASRHCYDDNASDRRAEKPVDENNHALAALRYLIARLDAHRFAKRPVADPPAKEAAKPSRLGLDEDDDRWWIPLG